MSSAVLAVMPMPPAAFSPLTTTKSSPSSSRSPGSSARSAGGPGEATTSPTKRMVVGTACEPIGAMTERRPATGPRAPKPLSARRRPPTTRGRARGRPALGPARRCCRSPSSAPTRCCARRAHVLLLFIIAGADRAAAEPVRDAAAPHAACRAGCRCCSSSWSLITVADRRRRRCVATRSPTRSRRSSDNVPGYVDDANAALDDVQEFFDDNGINVQIADQGQHGARDARRPPHRGLGRASSRSRARR